MCLGNSGTLKKKKTLEGEDDDDDNDDEEVGEYFCASIVDKPASNAPSQS